MIKVMKILIVIVAAIILASIWYFGSQTYLFIDKSCNVDSDCEIESARFCGMLCSPQKEDVYNKKTAMNIEEWRGNRSIEFCAIASCIRDPIKYEPKCVNKLCTIKKSIDCESESNKILICEGGFNTTYFIKYIEKELGSPYSEVKKSCNCTQ